MKTKVGNRIDFSNAILENENKIKGGPKVHYSLAKYKKKGSHDILTDRSENVTLVQLMDYLVNVNHAISTLGYWIFDVKYKIAPVINRELLDMIYAPSVGKEQVSEFEKVFTVLIKICSTAHLKKDSL